MTQYKLHKIGSIIGLVLVCIVLLMAFGEQVYVPKDLPCPLCLLQRVAFIAVGLCLCLNLQEGVKTSNYGLMILSSLLGFAISLRQVFLHVTPGDPGYGPLVLKLHLYNWSAVAFFIILGVIAIALMLEYGFIPNPQPMGKPIKVLLLIFLILILANAISTLVECGLNICPANPVKYYYALGSHNL